MMNPFFSFWGKTLDTDPYSADMNRLIDQSMELLASWQHTIVNSCDPDAWIKMSGQSIRMWENGFEEYCKFAFRDDSSVVADMEKELDVVNDNYAEALEQIKDQKQEIANLKREITRHKKELAADKSRAANQEKQIAAKDKQIANLEKEVKSLQSKTAKSGTPKK